ncbi:Hexokinase [Pseudoloma neurophilia]|uniref:Phosphotransferase n=1 Tax=Pseudoloma neurophilia TaxID=146866 RepID=A0A0R0M5K8_9MICR|nr:Hexokinase [Pseudoloma neurophilia]
MRTSNLFEWTVNDVLTLKKNYSDCLKEGKSEKWPFMFQDTFVYDKKIKSTFHHEKLLVIDFGGTTLKLGLYEAKNGIVTEIMLPKYIKIPEKQKIEHIEAFDWVAYQISEYLGDIEEEIYGGLTFSYPIEQISINSGKVLAFEKNFHFKVDPKNKDPVAAINRALKERGYNIKIAAIANDTTATLMSVKKIEKDHRIGIVLGTGTNATFFRNDKNNKKQAINLEWAGFNSPDIKRTIYDIQLEEEMKKSGNNTTFLDRFIGGYGFFHILNMTLKDMGLIKKDLTPEDIKKHIHDDNRNNEIFQVIKNIKTRTARVLTGLLLAVVDNMEIKSDETITFILNGTIFSDPFDKKIFYTEMKRFLKFSGIKLNQIRFMRPKDASLVGMVNILLSEVLEN